MLRSLEWLTIDVLAKNIDYIDFRRIPPDLHGYLLRKITGCPRALLRTWPGIYEPGHPHNCNTDVRDWHRTCAHLGCKESNTRGYGRMRMCYDMPFCTDHGPRASVELPAHRKLSFDDRFDYRWVNMRGDPIACQWCMGPSTWKTQTYYHMLLGPRICCVKHDETKELALQCTAKSSCRRPQLALFNSYTRRIVRKPYCIVHFCKRYKKGLESEIVLD
jgi:hypothetical protein